MLCWEDAIRLPSWRLVMLCVWKAMTLLGIERTCGDDVAVKGGNFGVVILSKTLYAALAWGWAVSSI